MATLRDIYDATHPEGNVGSDLTIIADGTNFAVNGRCHYSFDTNSRYVSYYLTDPADWLPQLRVLVNNPEVACEQAAKSVQITMGNPTFGVPMKNGSDLHFVGRMYLYVEAFLSEAERAELLAAGAERGLSIELRDLQWLEAYNSSTRPLGFLSHDSRDKDNVARPLALELGRLLCPVWFDEYSLKVGDSLSESIDRGIREAPKCILILSPNFLANPGWSKAEFKAIMNRHIAEGSVILPVWHNVTRNDVYGYSSFLVDIVASDTSKGLDAVARDLSTVLKPTPKPDLESRAE
jgi:TIR domain